MAFLSKIRLPYREDAVFGILVFLTLIVPLAVTLNTYEHYEVVKFSLWLMLLGWAVLAFVLKSVFYNRLQGYKPFFLILFLFWLAILISTIFSLDIHNSIFGFYPRFSSSLLFFSVWALYMTLLTVVATKEKLDFIVKVLIFDSLLISVIGILQSYGIAFYQGLATEPFQRAPSLLGNPNFSTMFTVMALPLAVVLLSQAKAWTARCYYIGTLFAILFCAVILSSRGSLLGLYIEMGVLGVSCLWLKFGTKLFAWVAAVAICALSLNYILFNLARPGAAAATENFSDTNIQLRLLTWKTGLKAVMDAPWVGVGPGNFQITFERHRDQRLASESGIFDDAHNIILQIAVTSGLPAMVLFGLLGLWAIVVGWTDARLRKDPLLLAAVSGVVGFFVIGSFNPVAMPCFLLLAFLLVFSIQYRLTDTPFAPVKLFKAACILLALAFVIYGLLLIVSEHLFFKGYEEYTYAANPGPAYTYTGWAIKLNPTNQLFFIYHNRAAIALRKSDAEVVKQIEDFKALNPTSSYSYSRAATSYFYLYMYSRDKKYFDLAVQNMLQAFAWDPYYAARFGRLGYFYFSGGDYKTSESFINTSLSLDNTYLPAWVLLAKIYQIQGNKDKTIYALTKAFALNPEVSDLRDMLRMAKAVSDIRSVPIPVAPQLEE